VMVTLRREEGELSATRETACQEFSDRTRIDEYPAMGGISATRSWWSEDRRILRQPPSDVFQARLKYIT